MIASARPESDRVRPQHPFTDSHAYYRELFERHPHAMWVVDEETFQFLDVNEAAVAAYGYSADEFRRMDISQVWATDDLSPLFDELRQHDAVPRVWSHRTKAGALMDVEVHWTRIERDGAVARLFIVRDVSEVRALEARLRQSQKIETVGQLAGGIAHDFNNLLTAISAHADVLSEYFATTDPRATEVAGIRHAADLAANLTRQLLAFSRKQEQQPRVMNVNDILEKSRRTLGRLLGERIKLLMRVEEDLWSVTADPGQIEQVMMNLVVNARDAMPNGGRVAVATRNLTLDAAAARRRSVAEGNYVELAVTDTGAGIEADVLVHLFEPFFTTKERGRGTGLGLAMVYGLVKQNGGHITVDTQVGRGSRFAMCLPASAVAAEVGADEAADGLETVLVVEGDATIQGLIVAVLKRRGYRVLAASGAVEAHKLSDGFADTIHLILTDVQLSRVSGLAVAEAIRSHRPDIRVIYLSGDAQGLSPETDFNNEPGAFLHKPFSPDVLARRVRAALDKARILTPNP